MKLLGMTTFSVLVDKNFGTSGPLGRYPRAPTREIGPLHEERYSQLLEMFQFYNPNFDERKYLSYGCNCHVFGNRPMSDPGFGPPVDSLDQSCKAYKDCNKCVKIVHGDTCEKSTYNYTVKGRVHRTALWYILNRLGGGTVRWTLIKGDKLTCTDSPDSCQRSLCECDAQFAKDHMTTKDVFNPSFQTFYASPDGKEMWHAREKCPRSGTRGLYNPQCCTNRKVFLITEHFDIGSPQTYFPRNQFCGKIFSMFFGTSESIVPGLENRPKCLKWFCVDICLFFGFMWN